MVLTMQQKDLVFNVGDLVWVSMQAVHLKGNLKLLPKWFGPFNMMEVHHNAYRLHFPDSIHVHPVINISFLKPYVTLLSSNPPQQVKHPVVRTEEFKVDAVIDHWLKGHQWQVLVQWVGFPSEQNTWEPISHLQNAPHILREYCCQHPTLPIPSWLSRVQSPGEDSVVTRLLLICPPPVPHQDPWNPLVSRTPGILLDPSMLFQNVLEGSMHSLT